MMKSPDITDCATEEDQGGQVRHHGDGDNGDNGEHEHEHET